MARRKKKIKVGLIVSAIALALLAAAAYLALQIFQPIQIVSPATRAEAAESCETKITKMLIDETLAFKFKSTEDIPFSELEINSWLHQRAGKGTISSIHAKLLKDRIVFSGTMTPFSGQSEVPGQLSRILPAIRDRRVAFKISTIPRIDSDRIFFVPDAITLGNLYVPPFVMPHFLDTFDLNPFRKESRVIKSIRVADGSLFVTIYVD
ncbi:MAG: hypothetical protein R3231_05090 [bacterium]|nr:hypothetical protein [bacterium]